MRLRTNLRRPGRYREDDVEELPPNPTFVVPTIPFNPALRPAVFPTLKWDELPPDLPTAFDEEHEEEEEDWEGVEKTSEEMTDTVENSTAVPVREAEPGLLQLPDGTWYANELPGEYDAFAGNWSQGFEQSIQERPVCSILHITAVLTN